MPIQSVVGTHIAGCRSRLRWPTAMGDSVVRANDGIDHFAGAARRLSREDMMADQDIAVVPLLSVRNGTRAIEFYKTAFGAREVFRIDNEKGEVVARLSVGQAEFWLADESPLHGNFSPESLGGGTVRLLLILEDPDAAFERAVASGAAVVWPVGNQHGWRVGRVVDPFGHHWEICKPLSSTRPISG